MLCKQCGFGLGKQANFCPSCGYKVTDEDRQAAQPGSNPAKWLKVLSALLIAGMAALFLAILFSDNMTEPVSEQLKAVKENRLTEAYYGYTSKAFREATSLEKFKEFVNAYPAFAKNESVRFVDRNSEHDRGALKAMIMTAQGVEIPVDYQLVKENDEWRIEYIKLADPSDQEASSNITEDFDATPIESVIQKQMGLIRGHNFKSAYEEYTSKDFRKSTSYADFEEFLKNNPVFTDNVSLKLHGLSFDNNIATIGGTLKQSDGTAVYLEYDLVQEDGEWKVFHVKIVDAASAEPELVFAKYVTGNAIGEDNLIVSPITVFKNKTDDIYFNLYVDNIKAGTEIKVVFQHLDSHSAIEPVLNRVSADGRAILTFIFSPPKNGWPNGNYRLLVTSSTGEKGSYDFKMED